MDQLPRLVEGGVISKLEPNQDPAPAFLRGLFQHIKAVQRMRDWLLEQDVAAGLRGSDRHIEMQGCRIGHDHRIRVMFCKCILEIRLDRIPGELIIGQRRFTRAQQDEILLAQGNQIAEMSSSNGTETGNEDFHRQQ